MVLVSSSGTFISDITNAGTATNTVTGTIIGNVFNSGTFTNNGTLNGSLSNSCTFVAGSGYPMPLKKLSKSFSRGSYSAGRS